MRINLASEPSVDKYWTIIKNAPSEIKIKLITLLSESLSATPFKNETVTDEVSPIELLRKVSGSWKGPESPEELIDIIREKRTSRP